jgi:DNA-binding NarL/FixJ family response regulator
MINLIIADDDELFIHQLKTDLAHSELNITFSHSAEHTVALAKTNQPDLILLDNHFPKLNGTDVIPLIKELSPDTRVMIMSSIYTLKEVERIILNQADCFFLKSDITKEQIFKIIEAYKISDKKGISFWNAIKNLTSRSKTSSISNIAIIEDDELFAHNLQWHLSNEFPNKLINTFNTPKKFLSYCEQSKPDLIFLDYYLEDGNALEIVKAINKMQWNPKIIVISSQEETETVMELRNLGIMGYIIKDNEWMMHLRKYLTLIAN